MKDGRVRLNRVQVLFDEWELGLVDERSIKAGQKTRSDYIRKISLTGNIYHFETSEIRKLVGLTLNATNNLNQIARKLNAGEDRLYITDIEKMLDNYDELRGEIGQMFIMLKEINNATKKL